MSKPEKQPDIQPSRLDTADQPVDPLVAKVLKYEPYLLALEIERDQVCTCLLGEMLNGNPSAEPQILELVKTVEQEGVDLKAGQLEASKRLRETWEAFKTLPKTDIIRILYDNRFDPYQTEKIPSPQPTTRRQRISTLQPETSGTTSPEFTELLRQRLKEKALRSITEGLERYMNNVAEEINRKVEKAMALYPKKPPAPQAISFDRFNLEDWDPETDGNVVVVREKPQPRIKLATDTDDDKPTFRLQ